MQRHPQFDIWMHDDAELADELGSQVTGRTTIHQWPLSCVQHLQLANGQSCIYKAQSPPSVEPFFYRAARSPLLVDARVLSQPRVPALVLEFVAAPRLCDLDVRPSRAVAIVDELVQQVARVEGPLPALADLRTGAGWENAARSLLSDLQDLVSDGASAQLDTALFARVEAHCSSSAVREALDTPSGYVHMDLLADNVLVTRGGYRVIDWQRPIWGPVALDRASLLESLGIDPTDHVAAPVVVLRQLLLIGWFAAQARHWFPPGREWFASEIVRVARLLSARR